MYDTQDFQASDATPVSNGATDTAPLQLPATLKTIAEYEGISYNTLKNRYFSTQIEPIYTDYECPKLRSDNGKFITEFGYQAIKRYLLKVVNGRMNYGDYVLEVQSKLVSIAPEIESQPVIQKSTSSLARRTSSLAKRSYIQHNSSDLTDEIESDVDELMDIAETNLNAFEAALLKRFEAKGAEVGAIAFEAYQASLQNKFDHLSDLAAKKQGVREEEKTPV